MLANQPTVPTIRTGVLPYECHANNHGLNGITIEIYSVIYFGIRFANHAFRHYLDDKTVCLT